jgi:hypothetical protein
MTNKYTYCVDIFTKNLNTNLLNTHMPLQLTDATQTGSNLHLYFPLIEESLTKRKNWLKVNNEVINYNIKNVHFSWTNSLQVNCLSNINSRILLLTRENYLSNKSAFYDKFKDNDFILNYSSFTKSNFNINISKFLNKSVIIKPDLGYMSKGILIQKEINLLEIQDHIANSEYESWSISEIFIPKLINGYIASNRVYFLVTRVIQDNIITTKSYIYKTFVNYRAQNVFENDILDPRQFLTNFLDTRDISPDITPEQAFNKARYIPQKEYLNKFTQQEQDIIYDKLKNMFKEITRVLDPDISSANYNLNNLENKEKIMFHVYGADILINDNLDVKILEINGAPSMNSSTRDLKLKDKLDYYDLIEEVIQKTCDLLYEPEVKQETLNNFILIYESNNIKINKKLFYIPESIITNYPYIFEVLQQNENLQRTRCLYDKNIYLFYGLREKYVVDETNLNYYDEILNYLTSKNMRNASVINKIQGITYFLANKGNMYDKLLSTYSSNTIHKFHPVSNVIFYDGQSNVINVSNLHNYIFEILQNNSNTTKWIIKPVHGSRGLGINIFNKKLNKSCFKNNNNKKLTKEITRYLVTSYSEGFLVKTTEKEAFNLESKVIVNNIKYKQWILCQYIDDCKLYNSKKFNIRFYVLIVINGLLPTYKDLQNFDKTKDTISLYLYEDFVVYFAILEYNATKMPEKYSKLNFNKYFEKLKNITNLELINNIYDDLNFNNKEKLQEEKIKHTSLLSKMYKNNIVKNIKKQAITIIEKTINSVKYDLRPLNRFSENYEGCFNLLAYDSMLDKNDNLWLIEVNRGPDLKGLELNIGLDKCKNMFEEMFKLCLNDHKDIKLWEKIKVEYDISK